MMSASEFFDCGPEPLWLVDACEGEIVSPNFGLQFTVQAEATSSVPYLEVNHSTEAGPSNSAVHMELDEVAHVHPNDLSFAHNPRQAFERFLQDGNFGMIQPVRQPGEVSLEQRRSWLIAVTANVANRVPTRKLPEPAPEQFLRASKKRKFCFA